MLGREVFVLFFFLPPKRRGPWALASLSRPRGDFLSYKWVDLTGNVT